MPGPVELQELLAAALDRTSPAAQFRSGFKDLTEEVIATLGIDRAATRIQSDQLQITATGVSTPEFTIPAQPEGTIAIYHHIGIIKRDNPAKIAWRIEVRYPRWDEDMRVGSGLVASEADNVLMDLMKLGLNNTEGDQPFLFGKTLAVFPGGILSIRRNGTVLDTERIVCRIMRELVPGPFSAEGAEFITGAFV